LPTKSYKQTDVFLIGLEKVSHFTEVFFYSESWEELQTMNTIQSQSNGNIEIGKARKVFDSSGKSIYIN